MKLFKGKGPTFADLVKSGHPENPRSITADQLEKLRASMERYGDLSGIVYNRRTSHVLCGHQRLKELGDACEIHIENEHTRNDTGTVAVGYVLEPATGERWPYRVVEVGDDVEREMMVAANAHGGEWNASVLAAQLEALKNTPALGKREDLTRALNRMKRDKRKAEAKPTALVESSKTMPDSVRLALERAIGGRTAQARQEPSAPVTWYEANGLLAGEVLDFGCGLDIHEYDRWDPIHHSDMAALCRCYDVIMCNYVLNVLPLVHQRAEVALAIRALLKDDSKAYALVAVWGPGEEVLSNVGYQSGWDRKEWRRFLESFFLVSDLKGAPFRGWKVTRPE